MPVDPTTARWLEALVALKAPKLSDLPIEHARAAFEKMCRLNGLAPVEVADIADRTIPGPGGDLPIRIYTPEGTGPFGVLVYFPGGGFVVGSPDSVHGPCTAWAQQAGIVVVSVNYRKGPEHPFPAAVDDAIAAVAWVGEHAAEFGADPARLAVAGDSAGGNLSAVAALTARDGSGPPIAAQVLIYPATDISRPYPSLRENAEGYFLDVDLLRWFGANYGAEPTDWRASPMLVDDLAGLAPALVVTAEYDPLRDQGEAYARRLADAGVAVTARRYDGEIHGFVANLAAVTGQGRQAVADIGAYLAAALAPDAAR